MEAVPAGIPRVLRASWKFAQNTAKRFSRELIKDRADEFLKKLAKRFV
jgi:phage gp16-like protein